MKGGKIMKNLKILLFFVLLSVFFAGIATAEEKTQEAEEKEKIVWKNPLPKMLMQMKHRAEEILDELKNFDDFPFQNFDDIYSQGLDNFIQELDEEINQIQICVRNDENQNDDNLLKELAVLKNKRNLAIKLAGILYEYEKYSYFYRQGEEYIKKLEELGWIIHYHDSEVFRKILSQFYDSRYRFEIDKELNITFDRIVIFSSDFPDCLITGVIKYNKYDNTIKFREDMVGFYFRGYLNNPMAIEDSEVFELRWLDSEGQKHIVWHPVMSYPFPVPIPVKNSLY